MLGILWDTGGVLKWQSQYNKYNDIYCGHKLYSLWVLWLEFRA